MIAVALVAIASIATCSSEDRTGIAGLYTSKPPAADEPDRFITLDLEPNHVAEMRIAGPGEAPVVVKRGIWMAHADERVRVILSDQDGRPIRDDITFHLEKKILRAIIYDEQIYGKTDLILKRRK